MRRPLVAIPLLFLILPASAQEPDNAVLRARDAFGERVGLEQAGLYTEQQVRGFDLNTAAAYRIEGAFVQREFQFPDPILSGVSVKVGVNAARLDYPSPSGVVDYRLRSAAPGDRKLNMTAGVRDFGTKFVDFGWSVATEDGKFGVAGGSILTPRIKYPNGTKGDIYNFGVVPHWQPTDKVLVRGVLSLERSQYDGDYSFATPVAALPPKPGNRSYVIPWADVKRVSLNSGIFVDAVLSPNLDLSLATFYVDTTRKPQYFSVLTVDQSAMADITLFRNIENRGRSFTGESKLTYRFGEGDARHALSTAVRGRQTRSDNLSNAPLRLGRFPLNAVIYPAEPSFPAVTNALESDVDQVIGSVGYAGTYFDMLELRGGAHRSRYTKRVRQPSGAMSQRTEKTWFYNASVVAALGEKTTLFANTVKGVEESGVAPQNALNRNEVLPPVIAKQYELGVRHALTQKLSLTVAGFDTTKLTAALRPDGQFGFVGDVRHRGGEVSLTGQLGEGTSVVIGGMVMTPRLSGQLVDAGLINRRPVGVSSTLAVASIDHRLSFAPNWSLDARMNWQGPRSANNANTFGTKGYVSASVGARYSFTLGGRPALLRLIASNLLVDRPWFAAPNGLLGQGPYLAGRATLRVALYE
ncbi:MAG: TonB-dependent receptor [Rhodospirillaceae bacterium]|nr:TonB-dependent receptor [Rhodospirillaceae bacterium]